MKQWFAFHCAHLFAQERKRQSKGKMNAICSFIHGEIHICLTTLTTLKDNYGSGLLKCSELPAEMAKIIQLNY